MGGRSTTRKGGGRPQQAALMPPLLRPPAQFFRRLEEELTRTACARGPFGEDGTNWGEGCHSDSETAPQILTLYISATSSRRIRIQNHSFASFGMFSK
jgi:hypothetical protein